MHTYIQTDIHTDKHTYIYTYRWVYASRKKLALSLSVGVDGSQQVVRNWKLQWLVNLDFRFALFTSCLGECRLSHMLALARPMCAAHKISQLQAQYIHRSKYWKCRLPPQNQCPTTVMFFVTPSSGLHNLLAKLKMLFCRRAKCVCFFAQLLIILMNPSRERIHILMRLDQRGVLGTWTNPKFLKISDCKEVQVGMGAMLNWTNISAASIVQGRGSWECWALAAPAEPSS